MKLKMKLGREAKFGREISAIEAMVYSNMQIKGWQLGNTLEETKKAHPDYFLKAAKTQMNKSCYCSFNVMPGRSQLKRYLLVSEYSEMFPSIDFDFQFHLLATLAF